MGLGFNFCLLVFCFLRVGFFFFLIKKLCPKFLIYNKSLEMNRTDTETPDTNLPANHASLSLLIC